MKIALIAAMAANRVIGAENRLPWHLPEDLKRFKNLTSGHPIIMGRKTFESLGRPLPNRLNIVVSRQKDLVLTGAVVVPSLEDAYATARQHIIDQKPDYEVFVIGGAEIYAQALTNADRIYLTLIEREVQGDAHFPEISAEIFREVSREHRSEPESHSYLVFERLP